MPCTECRRSVHRTEWTRRSCDSENRIICNCDWELRLGYGVAVSLAIFEAKRFFLLALELFVEWQIIRFAGGYRPVVLTCLDITLGFPCALAVVYTIREIRISEFSRKSRKIIVLLLVAVSFCIILNLATMVTIACSISVREGAIASVFNASMYMYTSNESCKYSIDQIQFVLQCCGHTSYADWFLFDWQLVDYASREEMSRHVRISDETERDRGVPFSCCNLRVLGPCLHSQMSEDDTRAINVHGCSTILSNFLARIVFVAYAMTSMLVLSQIVLAYFLARIARTTISKEFVRKTVVGEKNFDGSTKWATRSISCASQYREDNERSSRCRKYLAESEKERRVRGASAKCTGSGAVVSGFSDVSQESTGSETYRDSETRYRTARIKPSIHTEHRLPKKKPTIKGTR